VTGTFNRHLESFVETIHYITVSYMREEAPKKSINEQK